MNDYPFWRGVAVASILILFWGLACVWIEVCRDMRRTDRRTHEEAPEMKEDDRG
jgi:hypothetical protein